MRRRRTQNPGETLIEFLARELPSRSRDDAEYFARAIREAGERYDRYDERRSDWEKYSRRGARLRKLEELATDLAATLCSLDILSRDDLEKLPGERPRGRRPMARQPLEVARPRGCAP